MVDLLRYRGRPPLGVHLHICLHLPLPAYQAAMAPGSIGKCMDQILVLKSLIMTNVMTDLYIFILPIRAVWELQMRRTEKLDIISCFALGLA